MSSFSLKDFLTNNGDGPEFIICKICRYNQHGKCLKEESMANSMNPSDELYFGICKGFKAVPYPISPTEFAQLMKDYISTTVDEPYGEDRSFDDLLRYQLEFVMCETLIMLGYDEGVKLFRDKNFELPFQY